MAESTDQPSSDPFGQDEVAQISPGDAKVNRPASLDPRARERFTKIDARMDDLESRVGTERQEPMAVSREELDAKLQVAEARTETRFVELSGKLDRVLDAVANSDRRTEDLRGDLGGLRAEMGEVKSDNRNTRWTIIITVIASVLAALGALLTTQSTLLSAFQVRMAMPSAQSTPTPAKTGQ